MEAGLKSWKETDPKIDLRCRLFIALSDVFRAGAELLPLNGASMGADSLSYDKVWYIRTVAQGNGVILSGIRSQLPEICNSYLPRSLSK